MVHVDNVYVISRTVALTDLQRHDLECYIFIFMCNNFTLMCNNFTTLCSKVWNILTNDVLLRFEMPDMLEMCGACR
jgi:hypothetical protein